MRLPDFIRYPLKLGYTYFIPSVLERPKMLPRRISFRLWKLIQRENAVRYMLISLFSFIATVSIVRSYLALTGYPQIGNGTLHIAHVLWGGLILYIAAILPLIYLNPRLHLSCAILSGVGMGLFMDEVGKFITRQYDYFFPAAASILYVFFLLIVILVVIIRRPQRVDGRSELVQALEIVREQLYRPLEPLEREHIAKDMNSVISTDPDASHQEMARRLLSIVEADPRAAPETRPAWWLRISQKLKDWLTETRLSWLLGIGMVSLGLFTLKNPFQAWLEHLMPGSVLVAFLSAHIGREISASEAPSLYATRTGLEILIGITLVASAGLLAAGKKRMACTLSYFSLLVSLVGLDMLLFYFEQFSTVGIVLFQFIVLFGVIFFRNRYLNSTRSQTTIN